jgi:hypothetical protein
MFSITIYVAMERFWSPFMWQWNVFGRHSCGNKILPSDDNLHFAK